MKPPETYWKIGKILAKQENLSRREAEQWIESGFVYFEGIKIDQCCERLHFSSRLEIKESLEQAKSPQPAQFEGSDEEFIEIDPLTMQRALPRPITLLYHKPLGVLSAPPKTNNYPLAIDEISENNYYGPPLDSEVMKAILECKQSLRCCGRLDIHSKGLLILSSDMRVVRALINSDKKRFPVKKVYLVRSEHPFTHAQKKRFEELRTLENVPLLPFDVAFVDDCSLKLTLYEGRKHQIRKMLRLVGHEAAKIKRFQVGPFLLSKTPKNSWTRACEEDVAEFIKSFEKKN